MLFDRRQGMKFITAVHEFWYRMTGGMVGGNVFGAKVSPTLVLRGAIATTYSSCT